MTIHAYIGEKASRTSENLMLQKFLESLEERWAGSSDWIYVIANAMWEGAEIDLVCMLPSMILVADFKDFAGILTGKENGSWSIRGITVKGGAQNNPLVQLRNNRFAVIRWLKERGDLQGRNLGHISAAPIFSGPVEDRLDLSAKLRTWFHVTDLDHCANLLDALASPELHLSQKEAHAIVVNLVVSDLRWTRSHPDLLPIGGKEPTRLYPPLTDHQRDALQSVSAFLKTDAYPSMTIQGMTRTGKSHVLVVAFEEIVRQGFKPIPLTVNRRLALIGQEKLGIEFSSVYRHLYLNHATNNGKLTDPAPPLSVQVKCIPLQTCTDPEDAVYLIDDAHLLSDSYFQAIDGRVYGSGHLLTDFFNYSGLGKTQRKVIFFGDPYQIQRAGNLSVVNGGFQAQHGIANLAIELDFLITDTSSSARLQNAKVLVEAIRNQRFSTLRFGEDENFRIIDNRTAADKLEQSFRDDPFSVSYLGEKNTDIVNFTRWLRQKLHSKQELSPFEVGDMIELESVNTSSQEDFYDTNRPQPGLRYRVEALGPVELIEQTLRGRNESIAFRLVKWAKLTIKGPSSPENLYVVENLLEEYIQGEKPEISTDLALAIHVWSRKISGISSRHTGILPSENQEEIVGGLTNITLARSGYAATVHHAQGTSIPICFLNAKHSAGRHSEGYFRWLYTALTEVNRNLSIFNYEHLDPFTEANWNEGQAILCQDIPVGGGWHFDPQTPWSAADLEKGSPHWLRKLNDPKVSVAIYLHMLRVLEPLGWQVIEIDPYQYRERYLIAGPMGSANLSIAYKGNNTITSLHIAEAEQWPLLRQISHACVAQCMCSPIATELLEALRERAQSTDWLPASATETNYRLNVVLARNANERVELEIDYKDNGRASNIRPKRFSSEDALAEVKGVF